MGNVHREEFDFYRQKLLHGSGSLDLAKVRAQRIVAREIVLVDGEGVAPMVLSAHRNPCRRLVTWHGMD